ncbi:MAG: signal peptide peptidase SppA [Fibrobacteria bacterium]|nr:signal peptide peptidase SppA [Fibrobacteria bacterium]
MKTFLAVLGFVVALVASCTVGIGIGGATSNGFDTPASVSGPRVRVIRLEGTIMDPRKVVQRLEEAGEEEDVKAVVLRIETPGGAVGASQEIYQAVRDLDGRKPVVASIVNLGASGGYYAAVGARTIWANPGSLTGSIGVITQSLDAHALLEKIGVAQATIKSGEFKDAGSPFRPMTDREKALFQSMIDDVYGQFRSVVAERRGLGAAALDTLADGRILSGRQAFLSGLVDSLGTYSQAIACARTLADLPADAPVETDEPRIPLLRRLVDPEGEALSRLVPFNTAPILFRVP